jgi:hypothetical protein
MHASGERGVNGAAGERRVRAAAQNRGVAGFQAQRAGIRCDVGAALVDNSNNAKRHAHALDDHAVRPRPGFGNDAYRVFKRAHRLDGFGNAFDAGVVQHQAVEHGAGQAGGFGRGEVFGIGGENPGFLRADRGGHQIQRPVFLGGRRQGQNTGGGARGAADPGHGLRHGRGRFSSSFNAFQRRSHVAKPGSPHGGEFS